MRGFFKRTKVHLINIIQSSSVFQPDTAYMSDAVLTILALACEFLVDCYSSEVQNGTKHHQH